MISRGCQLLPAWPPYSIGPRQGEVDKPIIGVEIDRFDGLLNGLVVAAIAVKSKGKSEENHYRERIRLQRLTVLFHRLLISLKGQQKVESVASAIS